MSQLYLVKCHRCYNDNLFYSLRRENWVCRYCGYVIAKVDKGDKKGDKKKEEK